MSATIAGISGDTNAGMLARLEFAVAKGTKVVLLDRSAAVGTRGASGIADQMAELAAIEAKLQTPRHQNYLRRGGRPPCACNCSRTAFTAR